MSNLLPIWLLPFWTLGAPMLLALVDLMRTPKVLRGRTERPLHTSEVL